MENGISAVDIYIGARKQWNTITYIGMLYEIAIYNRLLTEDEIAQAAKGSLAELAVESLGKIAVTWGSIKNINQ